VVAPDCVPLFLTDGFKEDGTAILAPFGHWMQPERRRDKGPLPKPRGMPRPELLYAQVVKSYRRRRIVGGKHRVVFGTQLAIEQILAVCGWTINTAFIERLNLDLRQCVAAIGRRVNTVCQGEEGLRDRLVLFQTYHNFVLPVRSKYSCGLTVVVLEEPTEPLSALDYPFRIGLDLGRWKQDHSVFSLVRPLGMIMRQVFG
jgi:hypothetical protein